MNLVKLSYMIKINYIYSKLILLKMISNHTTGRPRKKLVSEFVIALLYGMIRD